MTDSNEKPYGREEVVAALINAAAELFAERGVEAVSIRDIASRAGVNHGLVHRHFGSKESLRKRTQEELARRVREEIGEPETFDEALIRAEKAIKNQPLFWKVMARTFLDGKFEGDIQGSFPFVQKMVGFVRNYQESGIVKSDMDPRYIIAAVIAYGLGMRVFESYIMDSTGLADDDTDGVLEAIQVRFLKLMLS